MTLALLKIGRLREGMVHKYVAGFRIHLSVRAFIVDIHVHSELRGD